MMGSGQDISVEGKARLILLLLSEGIGECPGLLEYTLVRNIPDAPRYRQLEKMKL
jgi:hypothetical protein